MVSRHSLKIQKQVARSLFNSRTATLPAGNVKRAAEESGVGRRTLGRWLKTESFQAIQEEVRLEILDAATTPLKAGDKTTVDKIVEATDKLATRILNEVYDIPIAKAAAALKELTHASQLLQGKPTDIIEHITDNMTEGEIRTELTNVLAFLKDAEHFGESEHDPAVSH